MYRKFVGRHWLQVTAIVALAGWTATSLAQEKKPGPPKGKDIVAVAHATPDLKTFSKLLTTSGLAKTLEGKGPYTVLAPTDEAFDKLGKEKLADLEKPENKAKLEKMLKNHIIEGAHDSAMLEDMKSVKTLAGEELTISAKDDVITIHGAKVTKADMKASNGLIHQIDTVLMPKD